MKLYVNTVATAGSFNVDYVSGTWAEGKITSSLAPALGAAIVSSVPITTASKNQYIVINITPAVQAWLNGSQVNDGIALVANSTFNATFDSKENTTTSHPPELDIVFAGGGGFTGITTASGSGLIGGGSSGTLNLSLTNACASGQVLAWSGTAWACANLKGGGTITGVTAGTDLTGGGTSGTVTLNLNTTKVPQLATANSFTGNQTVNGNVSATGLVTGSAYNIGSDLFAWGVSAAGNAFLGFAGNLATTGLDNTASGYKALGANTTGNNNTATGFAALSSNTTGYQNTGTGYEALASNGTGYQNTADGFGALGGNSTGNFNTATGTGALNYNTGGSENTADGAFALFYNTSSFNTATGYGSLYSNTTGFSNTANGINALGGNTTGNDNTAVGYQTLEYNATGGGNTAMGNDALLGNTTGNANTAIGSNALGGNTTGGDNTAVGAGALHLSNGSNNIGVGYDAGGNLTSGDNNVYIGNQGLSSESNTIRIGTGSGGTNPHTALYLAAVLGTTVTSGQQVYIGYNGQLGTINSSRRYKDDIQDMGEASSGLLKLRPVTFRYKKTAPDGSKPLQYGLIAEEVAEVYPDVVAYNAAGQPGLGGVSQDQRDAAQRSAKTRPGTAEPGTGDRGTEGESCRGEGSGPRPPEKVRFSTLRRFS